MVSYLNDYYSLTGLGALDSCSSKNCFYIGQVARMPLLTWMGDTMLCVARGAVLLLWNTMEFK